MAMEQKTWKTHVGTIGNIGTFSFFRKPWCIYDGGAIVTIQENILFMLKSRNHGALKKYDSKFSGRNSRLDTIQAGILNIKIKDYVYFKKEMSSQTFILKNLKVKTFTTI